MFNRYNGMVTQADQLLIRSHVGFAAGRGMVENDCRKSCWRQ